MIITTETKLVTLSCPVCGVEYAIPKRLYDGAREKPQTCWRCPNGHELHCPESQLPQIEERLEASKREAVELRQQLADLRRQLNRKNTQLRKLREKLRAARA